MNLIPEIEDEANRSQELQAQHRDVATQPQSALEISDFDDLPGADLLASLREFGAC